MRLSFPELLIRAAVLLAALSALAGGAAQARSPEALACAVQRAPAGLDARLADAMLAQQSDGPALRDLQNVVDRCGDDQFMDDAARKAYFSYAMGRMARDVLGDRLQAAGVPHALIDDALDIGPGKANNPAEQITQGDLRRITIAMTDAGINPASVTPQAWALINAYISATAAMFDGQRKLE